LIPLEHIKADKRNRRSIMVDFLFWIKEYMPLVEIRMTFAQMGLKQTHVDRLEMIVKELNRLERQEI